MTVPGAWIYLHGGSAYPVRTEYARAIEAWEVARKDGTLLFLTSLEGGPVAFRPDAISAISTWPAR